MDWLLELATLVKGFWRKETTFGDFFSNDRCNSVQNSSKIRNLFCRNSLKFEDFLTSHSFQRLNIWKESKIITCEFNSKLESQIFWLLTFIFTAPMFFLVISVFKTQRVYLGCLFLIFVPKVSHVNCLFFSRKSKLLKNIFWIKTFSFFLFSIFLRLFTIRDQRLKSYQFFKFFDK